MDHEIIAKLAASLKVGDLPPAQPQDIDAAVRSDLKIHCGNRRKSAREP
jgi:hypothetical protein